MKRRHASTLIELVILISIASSLMLLSITVLQRAMSISSVGRQRSEIDQATDVLIRQFRSDVHRATSVRVVDDQPALEIEMADGASVVYRQKGNAIVRLYTAATPESHAQQRYPLPDACQVTFRHAQETPERCELVVMISNEFVPVVKSSVATDETTAALPTAPEDTSPDAQLSALPGALPGGVPVDSLDTPSEAAAVPSPLQQGSVPRVTERLDVAAGPTVTDSQSLQGPQAVAQISTATGNASDATGRSGLAKSAGADSESDSNSPVSDRLHVHIVSAVGSMLRAERGGRASDGMTINNPKADSTKTGSGATSPSTAEGRP